MKTKFMGVAAALIVALALVFGVAAPGALPSLPAPTAQAQTTQTTVIPVSPTKRDFKNTTTVNSYTFTVDADATMDSLTSPLPAPTFLLATILRSTG